MHCCTALRVALVEQQKAAAAAAAASACGVFAPKFFWPKRGMHPIVGFKSGLKLLILGGGSSACAAAVGHRRRLQPQHERGGGGMLSGPVEA